MDISYQPRPYDLMDRREVMRLIRECYGYLRTCEKEHHGTDFEGRAYAAEALKKFIDQEAELERRAHAIPTAAQWPSY